MIDYNTWFEAAKNGKIDRINRFIVDGIEVNVSNNRGRTALFIACNYGQTNVVRTLLKCEDIEVDLRCDDMTPLMVNCMSSRGNEEIVKLLISHGADINAKETDGWDAIANACFANHAGIISILLAHGADIYSPRPYHKGMDMKQGDLFQMCKDLEKYNALGALNRWVNKEDEI